MPLVGVVVFLKTFQNCQSIRRGKLLSLIEDVFFLDQQTDLTHEIFPPLLSLNL